MLTACFILFFMFLCIDTYLLLMIYHIPVSSCDVVSNTANPLVVWNSTLYNANFKLSDASTMSGRFYARGDDLYSANLTGCVVIAILAIFAILAMLAIQAIKTIPILPSHPKQKTAAEVTSRGRLCVV